MMYNPRPWAVNIAALIMAICLSASHLKRSQTQAAECSLKHEMIVQRACEAAIWAMPAIGIYGIEASIPRDLDGKFGDVDLSYFRDLHTVIQKEPVLERDKAMMGLLASIGIEKGKPFEPIPGDEKAMLEGLQRAYDWMQDTFINRSTKAWWEDRQWQVWQFAEGQPEAGFPYVDENRILIDQRAGGAYFWITYLPKDGAPLPETAEKRYDCLDTVRAVDTFLKGMPDGSKMYRLHVPAEPPVDNFWAATVYDSKARSLRRTSRRFATVAVRARGSARTTMARTTSTSAPGLPRLRKQRLETVPGKSWFVILRMYGPLKPWLAQTRRPGKKSNGSNGARTTGERDFIATTRSKSTRTGERT